MTLTRLVGLHMLDLLLLVHLAKILVTIPLPAEGAMTLQSTEDTGGLETGAARVA